MPISRLFLEFVASDLAGGKVRSLANDVRGLGAAGAEAAKMLDKAGDHLAKGIKGAGIARELKAQLVDPGLAAARDMQTALKRLEANIDSGGAKEIAQFMAEARKEADRIAGPTKFDSKGVLDSAITEQIKAGIRPEDVLGKGGGAESAAFLAQADDTDIATANRFITDAAAKFGLAGKEIGRAADLAIRYSGASSSSVASLNEGLTYLTGLKELGLGADDTLALLATLDKQGLKGSTGGTSLNAFLSKMTTADQKTSKLDFYDKAGNFRGIDEMTQQLRTYFGSMTSEKQQIAAQKLFGDEGKRTLFALLQSGGDNSLEGVRAAAGKSRGLQERMGILSSSDAAGWEALGGTSTSTMATLFEPLLAPSTKLASNLNELVGNVGEAAAENENYAKAASGAAAAAVAGAGGYAAYQFAQAGSAGMRGLSMMRGLPGAGLAGGVVAGKAMEQLAGVTPVFVTNWPGALGAAGGVVPGMAGAGGGGMQKAMGGVAAFAGGWGVGTAINENLIQGTKAEDLVQGYLGAMMLATPMRAFADDETIAASRQARDKGLSSLGEMLGLTVNVNVDAEGRASVHTDGVDNVDVSARRNGTP